MKFYIVLVLLAAIGASAKEYTFFITDDGEVYYTNTNGDRAVRPEKLKEAKAAKDSQPAGEDPEGNWGPVCDGLQISIRFAKKSFATNDPVEALIIMRNIGAAWRLFDAPHGVASEIEIVAPDGKELTRKDLGDPKTIRGKIQRASKGPNANSVDPGMQRKQVINLSEYFDLSKPGKYDVRVNIQAYKQDLKTMEKIPSGKATIEISPSIFRDSESKKNHD